MLIALTGPQCAGKTAVARWLCAELGFTALRLRVDGNGSEGEADALGPDDVLRTVTPRWREHFVAWPVVDAAVVDAFRRRPFFLLVCVDAPTTVRLTRAAPAMPLDVFVRHDDALLYGPRHQLRACMDLADVTVVNAEDGLPQLHARLAAVNLADPQRLRPSWDLYFMLLASLAARRSNCMKRRVGAVLVRANRVIATGYNGTPRNTTNCSDGGCARCNANTQRAHGLDLCLCLHAEENALLEAGRERAEGATLYCSACPCLGCAKKIVQAGVRHVLYSERYGMDELSRSLFTTASVSLSKVPLPASRFYGLALGSIGDSGAPGADEAALLDTSLAADDARDLDVSFAGL